jgi:hypothetical protein
MFITMYPCALSIVLVITETRYLHEMCSLACFSLRSPHLEWPLRETLSNAYCKALELLLRLALATFEVWRNCGDAAVCINSLGYKQIITISAID